MKLNNVEETTIKMDDLTKILTDIKTLHNIPDDVYNKIPTRAIKRVARMVKLREVSRRIRRGKINERL